MPLTINGTSGTISNLVVSSSNLAAGIVKMDTLFSGAAVGGTITLSANASLYDYLIVHLDLATDTDSSASSNFGDNDWEQTYILTKEHINTGLSLNDPVDSDDLAVIGTTFYYSRNQTNNALKRVYGVKVTY